MLLIQLTGLSGAGKSTIANKVHDSLLQKGFTAEILDGDEYRRKFFTDLGFSPDDRKENIRRLGRVAQQFLRDKNVVLIAAINPYEEVRRELELLGSYVKTAWIDCQIEVLEKRDTKGLYRRARLPDDHPEKLHNLTGINDPYEIPLLPHLVIHTDKESENESAAKLLSYILEELKN